MIKVSQDRFAVVNVKSIPEADFFAAVRDFEEITLFLKESELEKINPLKAEKGFRLITFETVMSFDTVGFIAKVSSALAQSNIPVLVLSSYSTDHILVREKDLEKAVEVLKRVVE